MLTQVTDEDARDLLARLWDKSSLTPQVVLPTDENDDDEDAKKLEKQRLRTTYCMVTMQAPDPATGQLRSYQRPCGVWWLCNRCCQYRIQGMRERVTRAAESGMLRLVQTDDEEARKLAREYGKEKYYRIPLNDEYNIEGNGETFLMFIETADSIGKPFDMQAFETEFDWEVIINVPAGYHQSGRLGEKIAAEDKLPSVKHTAMVVDGLTEAQKAEAGREAVDNTPNLDPHTMDELEQALGERERAYARSVNKMGGKIVFRRTFYCPVNLEGIRWKMTTASPAEVVNGSKTKHPRIRYGKNWRHKHDKLI